MIELAMVVFCVSMVYIFAYALWLMFAICLDTFRRGDIGLAFLIFSGTCAIVSILILGMNGVV